jgi:hypothetical protein
MMPRNVFYNEGSVVRIDKCLDYIEIIKQLNE